ncbi:MAG: lysine--tRNA ligase [Planctomycetes bacterium]|nr:lysine--tRNA ligase [Planctomycetota bacterium]
MTDLAHPDRVAKARAIRARGADPFPARGVAAEPIARLVAGGGSVEAPGPRIGTRTTIAGRLGALRDFGKLVFAPVKDVTGTLQIALKRDALEAWWPQRKELDAGDLVGVTGELGRTQKGELTVWASEVKLLAKSYAPPPEKWHGLVDVEARYRRRYVDLWASDGVLDVFVKRSKVVSEVRRFLEAQGYLEVETPVLHPIAGGATARPFITHHNALDCDFYLRIAPELYLKRCIVGGLERVFEIARNFRNEGISTRHNPEFSMLELYEAQADYRRMMEISETLLEHLARAVNGTTKVTFRGAEYDLKAPFPRERYTELFRRHAGCAFDDEPAVRRKAAELGLKDPGNYWKLMNDVFEATVEDHLRGPLFVVDYPVAISPLAKQSPEDPRLTERFELFVAGMELGNAFSELNDPEEQERRFVEQVASKDPEAPGEVDVDYVQALEYGMPPTAGLGLGIDRIVMVLTNQDSIRDVLLFPALRPVASSSTSEASPAPTPSAPSAPSPKAT